MCFDFSRMTPKIKVQTLFRGSCTSLVLFGHVRGNLGKFGGNLGKKCAQHEKKCSRFFRQIWGFFGQKSFAPPKIYLLLHLCMNRSVTERDLFQMVCFKQLCFERTPSFITIGHKLSLNPFGQNH